MDKRKTHIMRAHRQLQHLMQATALEESGSPMSLLYGIVLMAIFVVFIIIWGMLAQVEELAVATGFVEPTSQIRVVRHLEGGIVSNVYFRDGQKVTKGQPVLELSSQGALSELDTLNSRANRLVIGLFRLQANLDEKLYTKEDFIKNLSLTKKADDPEVVKMLDDAVSLLKQQKDARDDARNVILKNITKYTASLSNLKVQIVNLQERIKIFQKQMEMFETLIGTKSISKISYLNIKEKRNLAQSELIQMLGDKRGAELALIAEQDNLRSLNDKFIEDTLKENNTLLQQLTDVQNTIGRARDKVTRLAIVAPSDGIVKGLEASKGSVVTAGADLFQIVPVNDALIVEARVLTNDVGHIAIDNKVNVKVDTFKNINLGLIQGRVTQISPSSFLDEKGLPYFKAKIALDKDYVGDDPVTNKVSPGMTASVEIITGSKSFLTYLLKPINRSFQKT